MEKKINCPYCGKETVYSSANPSRPFCSDRCRLIDLGEWASEKYAIPIKGKGSEPESEEKAELAEDEDDEKERED